MWSTYKDECGIPKEEQSHTPWIRIDVNERQLLGKNLLRIGIALSFFSRLGLCQ